MALKRMDNIGIVVDDLAVSIDFFREFGLELFDEMSNCIRLREAEAALKFANNFAITS